MRLHPYVILPFLLFLPACTQHPAAFSPQTRPLYATFEPNLPDIATLIATNDEFANFHANYDAILERARHGSPSETHAAMESLRIVAAREIEPGDKRLLRLAVLGLSSHNHAPPAQLAARARDLLVALAGDETDLRRARILILTDMHTRLPNDDNFSAAAIAQESYLLAQTYYFASQFNEATRCLDAANRWAVQDTPYLVIKGKAVANFTHELSLRTAAANTLAASPDNPAANATMGLLRLRTENHPDDAASFLKKAAQPELQQLGDAIYSSLNDYDSHLAIITAAIKALPAVTGEDQISLIQFLNWERQALARIEPTDKQREDVTSLLEKAQTSYPGLNTEVMSYFSCDTPGRFFQLETKIRRFVIIFDCSPRIGDALEPVKNAVAKSMFNMLPIQALNAVTVSSTAAPIFDRIQIASPENKREFKKRLAAIHIGAENDGRLDPYQDAFEKAFAMAPGTIYFVTDGRFGPRLLPLLNDLNSSQSARINVILFRHVDPAAEKQLNDLTTANGGKFKFLTPDELAK